MRWLTRQSPRGDGQVNAPEPRAYETGVSDSTPPKNGRKMGGT